MWVLVCMFECCARQVNLRHLNFLITKKEYYSVTIREEHVKMEILDKLINQLEYLVAFNVYLRN